MQVREPGGVVRCLGTGYAAGFRFLVELAGHGSRSAYPAKGGYLISMAELSLAQGNPITNGDFTGRFGRLLIQQNPPFGDLFGGQAARPLKASAQPFIQS